MWEPYIRLINGNESYIFFFTKWLRGELNFTMFSHAAIEEKKYECAVRSMKIRQRTLTPFKLCTNYRIIASLSLQSFSAFLSGLYSTWSEYFCNIVEYRLHFDIQNSLVFIIVVVVVDSLPYQNANIGSRWLNIWIKVQHILYHRVSVSWDNLSKEINVNLTRISPI